MLSSSIQLVIRLQSVTVIQICKIKWVSLEVSSKCLSSSCLCKEAWEVCNSKEVWACSSKCKASDRATWEVRCNNNKAKTTSSDSSNSKSLGSQVKVAIWVVECSRVTCSHSRCPNCKALAAMWWMESTHRGWVACSHLPFHLESQWILSSSSQLGQSKDRISQWSQLRILVYLVSPIRTILSLAWVSHLLTTTHNPANQ